ncbi:MAG: hypothetical protein HY811_09500 [Planctomycetes bacterium]|nr:hypothetical protein [Planctomycetota bacterium]
MTKKQNIKLMLAFGLFFVSLGGWLLHYRVHTPSPEDTADYIPFFIGIFNFVIVPWLFLNRKTLTAGYLLNGFTVIFGIIFMSHYSFDHPPKGLSFYSLVFETTLADILILIAKFSLGKALFDLEYTDLEKDQPLRFSFPRYPNLGWWIIHLAAIAAVYAIGVKFL